MKKALITLVISIVFLRLPAQECQDVVYPMSEDTIIFDCCIGEVKYGNIVSFVKDNRSYIIEAKRIVKDGKPYMLKPNTPNPDFSIEEADSTEKPDPEFYKNSEYLNYQKKFNGAKVQIAFGVFLTITGATANITSVVLAYDGDPSNDRLGNGLNIYGILAFNSGLPLWISGAVKKANNRKAMNRIKNSAGTSSLTLGFTNSGIGLVLNF